MLEVWGYLSVFLDPSLPQSRGQVPVKIGSYQGYLDRLFELELVNVELDGRKYHSCVQDRERDIRRDALLSTQGLLVVRYSHDRIVREPAAVVAELGEILITRRRQLHAA
jgi:very-short-patch-repair endonuclease